MWFGSIYTHKSQVARCFSNCRVGGSDSLYTNGRHTIYWEFILKWIFTRTLSHNRARVLHLKWAHNSSLEPLLSPFPIPQAARPHLVSAHASHARSDTSAVTSELRRKPAENGDRQRRRQGGGSAAAAWVVSGHRVGPAHGGERPRQSQGHSQPHRRHRRGMRHPPQLVPPASIRADERGITPLALRLRLIRSSNCCSCRRLVLLGATNLWGISSTL